jgi:uncharacterized protein YndB with AHSA1/START domain
MAENRLGIVQVKLEIRVEAPPARVWQALVDETGRWWPRDFYAGPGKDFILETRLGGRMYEDWGNGAGATWYTVTEIDPGKSLGFSGTMPAAFGGPAISLLRLVLRPEGPNGETTVLELTDSEFRLATEKAQASLDEGWRLLFEQAFKGYVESGEKV